MTREEAIEYVHILYMKAEITDEHGDMDDTEPYEEAIDMAVEALKARLPEEGTTFGKWIPCSERLPEEGERVLCTHTGGLNPNRQVIEHVYQNGKFVLGWDMDMNPSSPTFGQRYMGEVIAWMSLPEPYTEEQP